VRADHGGRLHFDVDLGPPHATQQYAFGPAVETAFAHARVTIAGHWYDAGHAAGLEGG
jgi:hypothetical protein